MTQHRPPPETGTTLAPLVKPAFTRLHLASYAAASGDFNRLHLDLDYAREAGHPCLVAHGMLTMAYLGELVAHAAGDFGAVVRQLEVRFLGVAHEGDSITCRGRVSERVGPIVRFDIWAEKQDGEKIAAGTAEVAAA